jgi:hypothetical protein
MSEEPKTGCICPLSGYCSKHQVNKTPHLHKLCQNHPGYFDMWENCKGPGQHNINCDKDPEEPVKEVAIQSATPETKDAGDKKLPGLIQQAKNLSSALVRHAASGFANVTPEVQEARLSICHACPHYLKESNRCAKCGCHLASKTKLSTSHCPIGLW